MEIHQLRYLVAVAEEGSFSRAAAKVRVAQPSLSQQIRKLEAEVGQPLFDRLPRSVVLTEAGRCLIDYARQILASIGDARRCVDEFKNEVAGRLAVGAIPTIAPYVLPELVGKFQKHYPEVTLEIVEDVTDGSEVWEVLQTMLPNEREQRLAYLLFHCGLKSREVVRFCPQEFSDVQEIYRMRRSIMGRLLRNADQLRWRLR